MKTILIILFSMILIGCTSSIKNPRLSLGKKCIEDDTNISYSYIWLYDKTSGMSATKEQC
jgi:uncharacterized protein YcfL